MMKKIILCVLILLTLCACGEEKDKKPNLLFAAITYDRAIIELVDGQSIDVLVDSAVIGSSMSQIRAKDGTVYYAGNNRIILISTEGE